MAAIETPAPVTMTVAGGYGLGGRVYTLGVNSGTSRIGLGVSDRDDAIMNRRPQDVSLYISMTAEEAEAIGQALVAHAARIRSLGEETE